MPDNLPPIHPGVFLKDELEALDTSARKFTTRIHVPHNAITASINGNRAVTAQMAIRLGRVFGTSAQYWMNLQSIYEPKTAQATMADEAIEPYAAVS